MDDKNLNKGMYRIKTPTHNEYQNNLFLSTKKLNESIIHKKVITFSFIWHHKLGGKKWDLAV